MEVSFYSNTDPWSAVHGLTNNAGRRLIVANLISSSRAKQAIAQVSFTTSENALVDTLCAVASAAVRQHTRRELLSASHDELASGLADDVIFLRQYPVTSITRVSLVPGDPLVDVGGYRVDSAQGRLVRTSGCWQRGRSNYRVLYTAGYATLPDDLVEACAQWVAALYWQSKDNPATAPELPTVAIKRLLAPHRRLLG